MSRKPSHPLAIRGATHIRTFTDPQNPARVAVLMDVPDLDAMFAALQTPAAADVMSGDGVLADTLVLLVETGEAADPRG